LCFRAVFRVKKINILIRLGVVKGKRWITEAATLAGAAEILNARESSQMETLELAEGDPERGH